MNTYIFGFDIMYSAESNFDNIFLTYNNDTICQIYPKLIYENENSKYYKINIKDIFLDMEIFPIYKICNNMMSLRITGYKLVGVSIVQHGYNYYDIKIPESVYISRYDSIIAVSISNIQNNKIYFGERDILVGAISLNIGLRYKVIKIMINDVSVKYNISDNGIYTLLIDERMNLRDMIIGILSPHKIANTIIYMTQYMTIKVYDNGDIQFDKYGEYLLKTC
jgi:hypothetical protein